MNYHKLNFESAYLSVFQILKGLEKENLDNNWFPTSIYKWSVFKKSRLIESIILDLPIPAMYILEGIFGRDLVLDGQKRISVIDQYVNNKFRLSGCPLLDKKYEDMLFEDLPIYIQRKIMDYECHCYILGGYNDPILVFEILERVTDQVDDLKLQALRNVYYKNEMKDISRLFADNIVLGNMIKPVKETAGLKELFRQELVLKFLAFYYYRFDMFEDDIKLILIDVLEQFDYYRLENVTIIFDNIMDIMDVFFGNYLSYRSTIRNKKLEYLDVLVYSLLLLIEDDLRSTDYKFLQKKWKHFVSRQWSNDSKKNVLKKWMDRIERR